MHIRTNHQVCLRGRSHLTAAATALLLAGASLLTASAQASSATGPSPSTTPSPPPSLAHLTAAGRLHLAHTAQYVFEGRLGTESGGGMVRGGRGAGSSLLGSISTVADATPPAQQAASRHHAHLNTICHPWPPYYTGCTNEQVRPLLRARFRGEYTGHAANYRYYRMGQHAPGRAVANIKPALNKHIGTLYYRAAQRYAKTHHKTIVGRDGVTRVVPDRVMYPYWAGFKQHTISICTGGKMINEFPPGYCNLWKTKGHDRMGELLWGGVKVVLNCDGTVASVIASTDAIAVMKLGLGKLKGGFAVAAGTEIGCQIGNLVDWAQEKWLP